VPLHASYEYKPALRIAFFAGFPSDLAARQVESWRRLLNGLGPPDPVVTFVTPRPCRLLCNYTVLSCSCWSRLNGTALGMIADRVAGVVEVRRTSGASAARDCSSQQLTFAVFPTRRTRFRVLGVPEAA